MLFTELVINAFKSANPDDTPGEVRVTLERLAPSRIRLEVCDRGVGLPAGFDLNQANAGLGMRLISTFTRELEGTLNVVSVEPGARFVFDIPGGDRVRSRLERQRRERWRSDDRGEFDKRRDITTFAMTPAKGHGPLSSTVYNFEG